MDTNKTIPGTCRLMRIREVLQLCGLSRATLYREIKLHSFPAPVKLSARSVGWLQDDVVQWLNARVAQRGPAYHPDTQADVCGTRK
jgi:predicted DNA-binding transcriptional regulator AlpA